MRSTIEYIVTKQAMMFLTGSIVSLVLIGLLAVVHMWPDLERFALGTRFVCPTRNSSHDLRGDPIRQKRSAFAFGNSAIGPMDPEAC